MIIILNKFEKTISFIHIILYNTELIIDSNFKEVGMETFSNIYQQKLFKRIKSVLIGFALDTSTLEL